MVQLTPLDPTVPIFQQISADLSPVILVNIFKVAEGDIPALLQAWEADANWMKQQPAISRPSCIGALRAARCS